MTNTGQGSERVVLVYSGGTAGARAMRALGAPGRELVTLTVDVGQARELTGVRERALASGATRAHVVDAREEFATAYVWASVQAGVAGTAQHAARLALPLVARTLVDIARIERASVVAHEYDGADADLFERLVQAIDPAVRVSSVHRQSPATAEEDSTLWARTLAGPGAGFVLTRDPALCPEDGAVLDIAFENGRPARVNGIEMDVVELVESLETIAGMHGVGRCPSGASLPPRPTEAPAAVVLETAYRACERARLDEHVLRLKADLAAALVRVIGAGRWFSLEREAIRAFTAALQPSISGSVRLVLRRGTVNVTAVRSAEQEAAVAAGGR